MNVIRSLFSSKKFFVALTATIAAVAGLFGLDLSPEEVALLVGPLTALIVAQGVADHGKEAMRIAQEVSNATPPTLRPDPRLDALDQWVRAHAATLGIPVPDDTAAGPAGVAKP